MMLEGISLRKLCSNERLTSVPMYHPINIEFIIVRAASESKKIIQEFIISQDYKKQKLVLLSASTVWYLSERCGHWAIKWEPLSSTLRLCCYVLRLAMRHGPYKLEAVRGDASGGDGQWRWSLPGGCKNVYLHIWCWKRFDWMTNWRKDGEGMQRKRFCSGDYSVSSKNLKIIIIFQALQCYGGSFFIFLFHFFGRNKKYHNLLSGKNCHKSS